MRRAMLVDIKHRTRLNPSKEGSDRRHEIIQKLVMGVEMEVGNVSALTPFTQFL
jgi:hypothetical protein